MHESEQTIFMSSLCDGISVTSSERCKLELFLPRALVCHLQSHYWLTHSILHYTNSLFCTSHSARSKSLSPPPKVKEVVFSPLFCLFITYKIEHFSSILVRPFCYSFCLSVCLSVCFSPAGHNFKPIFTKLHHMEQFVIMKKPIDFEVKRSTTSVRFLNSSIFIWSTWNLKRIYISGHWIQPTNYFWGQHRPKRST